MVGGSRHRSRAQLMHQKPFAHGFVPRCRLSFVAFMATERDSPHFVDATVPQALRIAMEC